MKLENIRQKIDEGVFLNLISTEKFKTNLISFYIIRPLKRDEVTKNALIPLVLKRGTKNYNSSINIQKKLETLYGANLSIDVNKMGERQVIRFSIEAVNSEFVKEENLLKQVLVMLNEVLYNPYIENNAFSREYVNQEKENLRKKIISRINDKKQYAVERCIEEMCKNERYGLYTYGYIEDLDDINNIKLYEHYKSIMETSPMEISVIGNIEKDKVLKLIKDCFSFERKEIIDIPRENVVKAIKTKNMISESLDINQGKLCLGLRTNVPYEDKLYEPFLVGNNILGGGANSKLFEAIREKESLAYYIYSKSFKYKSIMIIASGIEFENFDKALQIIKEQINEMKEGKFSESDIEDAKNSIVTSIRSMKDSNFSMSEFYLSQAFTKDNRNMDEIIDNIRDVNKEDIINALKNINLDTIYFLKKKE